MRPLVWGATGLERWYELGQIDWVIELEYWEVFTVSVVFYSIILSTISLTRLVLVLTT
jgi:hypothetical protein